LKVVLVRHGTREQGGGPDKLLSLTEEGRSECVALGRTLCSRHLQPEVVFCSWYAHARETAEIIAATCGPESSSASPAAPNTIGVVELCTLTPQFPGSASWALEGTWAGISILEWISSEATKTDHSLVGLNVAVLVMHQPRMTQVLSGMTGGRVTHSSFTFADGICVSAKSLDRLLAGQGEQDGELL
jgi:phosphohistidine phosphatase SixA